MWQWKKGKGSLQNTAKNQGIMATKSGAELTGRLRVLYRDVCTKKRRHKKGCFPRRHAFNSNGSYVTSLALGVLKNTTSHD